MAGQTKHIEKYILETVRRTILDYRMLKKDDAVLVGVSGGGDSMALLHILRGLTSELGIALAVAHLNHGIRGREADNEAAFVLKAAEKLSLKCHIEKINVKEFAQKHNLSLEHGARRVRYSFFSRLRDRYHYSKLALGHHLDDNAEMVLMALFRGSGPLGLSGIPPVRDGHIIRPLIRLTRENIHEYLSVMGIAHVQDISNIDPGFLRNKIRHRLMPLLKAEYNPSIEASLVRTADILGCEEEWIGQEIKPYFQSSLLRQENDALSLSAPVLNQYHPAVKRRIIRMALENVKGDLKRITLQHVDAVVEMLNPIRDKKRLDLPGRIMVVKDGGALIITKERQKLRDVKWGRKQKPPARFSFQIKGPGNWTIPEANMGLSLKELRAEDIPEIGSSGQHTAFFDIKKIRYPLTLRNFGPEDRFSPLGMKGRKTVDKYLKDRKIPGRKRGSVPVLVSGDNIIWVVGYQIGNGVKVAASTKKVLNIKWHPCLSGTND